VGDEEGLDVGDEVGRIVLPKVGFSVRFVPSAKGADVVGKEEGAAVGTEEGAEVTGAQVGTPVGVLGWQVG